MGLQAEWRKLCLAAGTLHLHVCRFQLVTFNTQKGSLAGKAAEIACYFLIPIRKLELRCRDEDFTPATRSCFLECNP